jgi:hypothetical protein
LTVDSFGYTAVNADGNDYVNWGAVFTNPNTEWVAFRLPVRIEFFGPDDAFLGDDDVPITILPGQTTALVGQGATSAVTRMVVTPAEDSTAYIPFASSGTIEVSGVESVATDTIWLTTGMLTSTLTSDQTFMPVNAVYRDDQGNIVGGATGGVESIPSGATVPFEIADSQRPPSAATTEVYWQLGGQLPR